MQKLSIFLLSLFISVGAATAQEPKQPDNTKPAATTVKKAKKPHKKATAKAVTPTPPPPPVAPGMAVAPPPPIPPQRPLQPGEQPQQPNTLVPGQAPVLGQPLLSGSQPPKPSKRRQPMAGQNPGAPQLPNQPPMPGQPMAGQPPLPGQPFPGQPPLPGQPQLPGQQYPNPIPGQPPLPPGVPPQPGMPGQPPLPGQPPFPPREQAPVIVSPNAGSFQFNEETHDYGVVTEGGPAETDFHFKNVGKEAITISEAHGSCGCTVPTYPKEPIAPGATGIIHVVFNTKGRVGPINKDVIIRSDAKQQPMTLHIKGEVRAAGAK